VPSWCAHHTNSTGPKQQDPFRFTVRPVNEKTKR
jgi:hypothetical protein